jgi:hypothetical protein
MMAGMEDDRSAEAVEHLQAAARELLLAARSFLDVVEDVVEDRERLVGAASSVVDLLRDGVTGAMSPTSPLQPWEQAAWGAGASTEPDTAEPDTAEPDTAEPDTAEPDTAEPGPGESSGAAKSDEPAASTSGKPAAPRRVRRISVD